MFASPTFYEGVIHLTENHHNLLIFDHFFGQDIAQIRHHLDGRYGIETLPYIRIRDLASKIFPEQAFGTLEQPFTADMSQCWSDYQVVIASEARWLIAAYRPSLFIVPSDTIFYLRPLIFAFRALGLRTLVVQKETTITEHGMAMWASLVGKFTPFIGDFMTVCSEHHKDFWIAAGSDSNLIVVTGQPRFDFYLNAEPNGFNCNPQHILYLSFDDVAYLPADSGYSSSDSWRDFRRELEIVISKFTDKFEIIAKRHPQQMSSDSWLGNDVITAAPDQDTRLLVLESDIVIGFQTTTVYEAVLAGKRVIYPAWGATYERNLESLIRYDMDEGSINIARSQEQLYEMLRNPDSLISAPTGSFKQIEHLLGPLDGRATERVASYISTLAARPSNIEISLSEICSRYFLSLLELLFFRVVQFAFFWSPKIRNSSKWRSHLRQAECSESLKILMTR